MKRTLITAVTLLALALVGCSDDDDNPISSNIMNASLRVAHLSPDAPAVDIWVDGTRVLQNFPYKAFSDYLEVPAGAHNVQVTPAGATTPVVIDANVTLTEDVAYTVAATGLLNSGDLSPIVLVDDRTPQSGSARVRFVHSSADAPAVNVGVASGPTLFSDVEFREASTYLSVDAGTYDLSVQVAANGTEVLQVNGQSLTAGVNYTVFAIGLAGDGTLSALPVVDADASGTSAAKMTAGVGSSGKLPIFPLAQKAGLKTLATALQATKLQKTLTIDGPFTVFAPTEEAFAALPPGTLESLLTNPAALTQILLYHVVAGEVKAADVITLTEATTLNGAKVDITVNGDVMINDAKVIATDIMAKNGVVHLIDKVLIPPTP
jgi:uncharacterized surface protein with fasciclin (FAS1) repeats